VYAVGVNKYLGPFVMLASLVIVPILLEMTFI
jgi:hypothetical protein